MICLSSYLAERRTWKRLLSADAKNQWFAYKTHKYIITQEWEKPLTIKLISLKLSQ